MAAGTGPARRQGTLTTGARSSRPRRWEIPPQNVYPLYTPLNGTVTPVRYPTSYAAARPESAAASLDRGTRRKEIEEMVAVQDSLQGEYVGASLTPGEPSGRSRRPIALVITPDPSVRSLQAMLLAGEGFEALGASNGYSGLRLAQQLRPELVVLEPVLSEVSGDVLLRELRRDPATRDIPVLIVSASAHRLRESLAHLVAGVVGIPFEVDEFLAQVRRARHTGQPVG